MYSRKIANQVFQFGVSGLLYKSNVLMYDQKTESLWSQVLGKAVTGPMTDTRLRQIPSTLTSWKKWLNKHPETTVLTPATGHVRDYSKDPYESYYKSRSGIFGFLKGGPGAEDKELVVGIKVGNMTKAYKLEELREAGLIEDKIGNKGIRLEFDKASDKLKVIGQKEQIIDHMVLYWFVWKSIYPDAEIY